jgi:hypothetical protein
VTGNVPGNEQIGHGLCRNCRLIVPPETFDGMATDHPEPHQVPRYLGRFSCTAAFDEPRQCAAIVLEIVTHAIQPFGLSGSNQPVGGEGRFSDAIASEPFECVVTLA